MTRHLGTVTNLELRASNPDGTEGAGLSHTAEGLHLLHVYEIAGPGEPRGGVTIVHDLGDHGGRYIELAEDLVDDGWALALPDLRGHGRSEGPRGHSYGIAEPVRDLDAVQDHVAYRLPDHPKVLVGIGLGGLYALAYAQRHPDRLQALVLVAPLLEPQLPTPPRPSGLRGLFKKPSPLDSVALGWSAERRTGLAEARRELERDELVHDLVTRHLAERLPAEAAAVRAQAAAGGLPTLVLLGSDDPLVGAGTVRVLERPGVEVETVAGARHDLLHDAGATETAARIRRWIDRTCPRR
jgi:alpha-beta hydrolase superfamily lysophospholipase